MSFDFQAAKILPLNSGCIKPEFVIKAQGPLLDWLKFNCHSEVEVIHAEVIKWLRVQGDYVNNNFLIANFCNHIDVVLSHSVLYGKYPWYVAHPDLEMARKVVTNTIHIANKMSEISRKISSGGYIVTPIQDQSDVELAPEDDKKSPIIRSTAVHKEMVASFIDKSHKTNHVVDIGGGYGNYLKYVLAMGLVRSLASYTIVDLNEAKLFKFSTSEIYRVGVHHHNVKIHLHKMDLNDYLKDHLSATDNIVSINSAHYIDYGNMELISSARTFDGIAMISDPLIDFTRQEMSVVKADNFKINYDPITNIITGTIMGLRIREQPVVSQMLGSVYPLLFTYPYRLPPGYLEHPYFKSFCAFSKDKFIPKLKKLEGRLGTPMTLVSNHLKIHMFNRPALHKVTHTTSFWYNKVGSYASAKLNGVAAFAFRDLGGNWKISIRGGVTLIPYVHESSTPYQFARAGGTVDTVFVELVLIEDKIYPFYLDKLERGYNTVDSHSDYWDNKFVHFSSRFEMLKDLHSNLSFKTYVPVQETEQITRLDLVPARIAGKKIYKVVACDGIVLTDNFNNFKSYWKPIESYDVYLMRNEDGVVVATDYDDVEVVDENDKCVLPGVYECYNSNGVLYVGCLRPDKFVGTDLQGFVEMQHGYDSFCRGDNLMEVTLAKGAKVAISELTMGIAKEGKMAAPYEQVMNKIIGVTAFAEIIDCQKMQFANLLSGMRVVYDKDDIYGVPVTSFISFSNMIYPSVSPLYVWRSLHSCGFATRDTHKAMIIRNSKSGYSPIFTFHKKWVNYQPL